LDVFLSPLSDVSPLTFFYPSTTNLAQSYQNCPVAAGDKLTFYVTNPETSPPQQATIFTTVEAQ
jgi:hypothetical protein